MPRNRSASLAAKEVAPPERSYAWLQGLLCGIAATVVPGPALLAGLLLAPSLVALLFDQSAGKPMARAVLLCGLAATIPPMAALWHQGASIGAAFTLLGDPPVLGAAWACGAGGWLMNELAPLLLRVAMDATAGARIARLKAERARVVEEWELTSVVKSQANADATF